MTLKFFKTPVLLVLFSTFLPSLGFTSAPAVNQEEDSKPSIKMRALIPEMERLEQTVEQLTREKASLVKHVTAHIDFLGFVFAANRNNKDYELIKGEYLHKYGQITPQELFNIQQRVSNSITLNSLPTDLNPVLNGGISAGVPAIVTSNSVTNLAREAGALLSPDTAHSTRHRRMTIGTIPPSTIGSSPTETELLSTKLNQVLCLDEADGSVVREILNPATPKVERVQGHIDLGAAAAAAQPLLVDAGNAIDAKALQVGGAEARMHLGVLNVPGEQVNKAQADEIDKYKQIQRMDKDER